jgi:hypothetical protein
LAGVEQSSIILVAATAANAASSVPSFSSPPFAQLLGNTQVFVA